MRLMIVPLISFIVASAGATVFNDPPKTITRYTDESCPFGFNGDPTDQTGTTVVAAPFKTLTVVISLTNSDATKPAPTPVLPSVATTVAGASVTPFLVPEGYKFILVLGSDGTPADELFNATFKCPSTAGTYLFTVVSATATNAAGESVQLNLPVKSPDTIIIKARPKPWWAIWRAK